MSSIKRTSSTCLPDRSYRNVLIFISAAGRVISNVQSPSRPAKWLFLCFHYFDSVI